MADPNQVERLRMRVLLLSFYFEPDIGPGAFRSTAWALAMNLQLRPGDSLEVFTTRPNRYASFAPPSPTLQQDGAMVVHRFDLPAHRSGFIDQSRAFIWYAVQVWRHSRGKHYDLVCATSSRLMTAVLASWMARRYRARLFLDIRDLFVDAIGDLLPWWTRPLRPVFSALERFAFSRAQHINLVSAGFFPYVKQRYPEADLSVITNGIDDEFLDWKPTTTRQKAQRRVQVLYAGNIGDGQRLHVVLPELARRLSSTHEFHVVGDGGARHRLIESTSHLENVRWAPPVSRLALLDLYREADVLFLHLADVPAFRKVLPSKLFEYLSTGKPILAGLAGHAAEFLCGMEGVTVVPPCDVEAAAAALASIDCRIHDRASFVASNARSRQMEQLAREALALVNGSLSR